MCEKKVKIDNPLLHHPPNMKTRLKVFSTVFIYCRKNDLTENINGLHFKVHLSIFPKSDLQLLLIAFIIIYHCCNNILAGLIHFIITRTEVCT